MSVSHSLAPTQLNWHTTAICRVGSHLSKSADGEVVWFINVLSNEFGRRASTTTTTTTNYFSLNMASKHLKMRFWERKERKKSGSLRPDQTVTQGRVTAAGFVQVACWTGRPAEIEPRSRLIDCNNALIARMADTLIALLIDWLMHYVTDWLTDWLTDRLTDWLTAWLTDWLTDRLTDWLTDWPLD